MEESYVTWSLRANLSQQELVTLLMQYHNYFKISVEYECRKISVKIKFNKEEGEYELEELFHPDALKDNPQFLADRINRMCEYILKPIPNP